MPRAVPDSAKNAARETVPVAQLLSQLGSRDREAGGRPERRGCTRRVKVMKCARNNDRSRVQFGWIRDTFRAFAAGVRNLRVYFR